jgi:hypothetical protein
LPYPSIAGWWRFDARLESEWRAPDNGLVPCPFPPAPKTISELYEFDQDGASLTTTSRGIPLEGAFIAATSFRVGFSDVTRPIPFVELTGTFDGTTVHATWEWSGRPSYVPCGARYAGTMARGPVTP